MKQNNINEAVKKFIKRLHIPQAQIARELNVTPQTVNRWVKGNAEKMQNYNLRALAKLGDCIVEFNDDNTSIKFHKKDYKRNDNKIHIEVYIYDMRKGVRI